MKPPPTLVGSQRVAAMIDEGYIKFQANWEKAQPLPVEKLNEIKRYKEEAAHVQGEFKEMHRHSGCTSELHSEQLTLVLDKFRTAIKEYKNILITCTVQ